MVTITSRARDYLKSVSNGDYVTLGVKGGGCSGLMYEMDFDTEQKEGDQSFEDKGITIVVDKKSFLYFSPKTINVYVKFY